MDKLTLGRLWGLPLKDELIDKHSILLSRASQECQCRILPLLILDFDREDASELIIIPEFPNICHALGLNEL